MEKFSVPAKNIIAVGSGKGGVGKSTVAVNLALALAKTGLQVGILDADIYGPNIPIMLGVDSMPASEDGQHIQPAEASGVQLISMGLLVKAEDAMLWRGPMLHNVVRQFLSDVQWPEMDYLIIDLPPGTGDIQISLCQNVDMSGGLIVTSPQRVSVADARRGITAFQKFDVPVLGIIENMSGDLFGEGGGEAAAKEAAVPFLGRIAMDRQIREQGDSGKPVVLSHPESEAARAFHGIARTLAES